MEQEHAQEQLVDVASGYYAPLENARNLVAELDVLAGWAHLILHSEIDLCKPVLVGGERTNGR